ncbi:MAG TPA: pyridoxal-phosphate dependent enzyme, partial [Streptosporangiaceae bacterium]
MAEAAGVLAEAAGVSAEAGGVSAEAAGVSAEAAAGERRALVHESVLDAIGQTPLIRLTRVTAGLAAPVYVKAEFLSVGASVKDRAARNMVRAAEQDGSLRPGGVIVESTSGNTGIGLAIVAAVRGYRSVVVVPDKTSSDKLAVLRAHGAEVVLAQSGLPREHPDHPDQIARRIAAQTPGGWLAGQYDNPANPQAHWDTTGPEIWAQTAGRVTHLVAGAGTGGTITGTGEYLKAVSGGRVQVIGADPATSVYGGGDGSPYYIEAVGHWHHPDSAADTWPQSFHPAVVDRFESVSDRESIAMIHRLAREEGLLLGGSAGTAIAAALRTAAGLTADDLVVVIAPDSGRGYLSKYFSEPWLLANGFRDPDPATPAVADLVTASRAAANLAAASGRPADRAAADRATAVPPVLVLTLSATVADARRAFADSGAFATAGAGAGMAAGDAGVAAGAAGAAAAGVASAAASADAVSAAARAGVAAGGRSADGGSRAGAPELALVALPRRGMGAPRALGDVVGALRRSALDGQPDDQLIA